MIFEKVYADQLKYNVRIVGTPSNNTTHKNNAGTSFYRWRENTANMCNRHAIVVGVCINR